ncbi:MAG: TIGR04372 family glycosyltransferase [Pseudomonadota bacterium]
MKQGLFRRDQMSENELCWDVGRKPERPFVIKAALRETSLGDMASKLACLATIKAQFDHAELHIRYRDVRPYSREMMSLIPNADRIEAVKWDIPAWARFWIPDARLWHPMARALDGRKGSWNSFCDFYPSDWMLNPRWMHAMPNPVPLRVPEGRQPGLSKQLVELGLDPENWFAAIHYRASTYLAKRSGKLRNSDPDAQRKLIDYIIDDLGGQAVLLGHPELEAFPARKRFVDLSRIPNAFMLQASAASQARFMVAGPSGPIALGWSMQIPTAMVDASDAICGWGDTEHVLLTHEVTTPDRKKLRNRELFEAGLLDYRTVRDRKRAGESYEVRKNSAEELSAAARHMYEKTGDTPKWRGPRPESTNPRPNQFVWPPQTWDYLDFLDI